MKFLQVLKSRKFWAAVVAVAFVLIESAFPNFPLSEDQVITVVWAIVAYIIGVAIDDNGTGVRRT